MLLILNVHFRDIYFCLIYYETIIYCIALIMGSSLVEYVDKILELDNIHVKINKQKLLDYKELIHKIIIQLSLIYQLCVMNKNPQKKNKILLKEKLNIAKVSSISVTKNHPQKDNKVDKSRNPNKIIDKLINSIKMYFS